MPCSVTITSVLGITDGVDPQPHTIVVTGQSTGCVSIHVAVQCSKATQDVTPNADGSWQATIDLAANPPNLCQCGSSPGATATGSASDQQHCDAQSTGALQCQSRPQVTCPSLAGMSIGVGTCNSDGTRTVTFVPNVVAGTEPVSRYHWEFGGIADQTIYADDPAHPSGSTSFDFPAPGSGVSEYTITVTLVSDNCVDSTSETIRIQTCNASCPVIDRVTATAQSCVGKSQRRIVLNANISGGSGDAFDWEFGDPVGSTRHIDSNNPATTKDYPAPGHYTARLTMHGPDACPDQSEIVEFDVAKCDGGGDPNVPFPLPHNGNGNGGNGGTLCGFLLHLAIVAIVLAAVAIVIAGCLWGTPYAAAAAVAAGVLAALALAALLLWMKVCARGVSKCRSLHKLYDLLGWLDTILLALGSVGTVLGMIGISVSLLPCGLGFIAAGGYVAAMQGLLHKIAVKLRCHPWRDNPRQRVSQFVTALSAAASLVFYFWSGPNIPSQSEIEKCRTLYRFAKTSADSAAIDTLSIATHDLRRRTCKTTRQSTD